MRKSLLTSNPTTSAPLAGALDVAALATVAVTSETAEHPVENAFDNQTGPGGSRWVAAMPGEQTLILTFDTPQDIHQVLLEVEETQESRTQELHLAVSHDGGNTYREVLRQEFNFAPSATTFEREEWTVAARKVTQLRLCIKPDKGGRPCRASITSLSLR